MISVDGEVVLLEGALIVGEDEADGGVIEHEGKGARAGDVEVGGEIDIEGGGGTGEVEFAVVGEGECVFEGGGVIDAGEIDEGVKAAGLDGKGFGGGTVEREGREGRELKIAAIDGLEGVSGVNDVEGFECGEEKFGTCAIGSEVDGATAGAGVAQYGEGWGLEGGGVLGLDTHGVATDGHGGEVGEEELGGVRSLPGG